jgi:putative hydrolase of the HAD superfamily
MPPTPRNRPQVIFFDAVGTLFGVRGSVGRIYGEMADRHGVRISHRTLDHTFYQSFKAAGPSACPGLAPGAIPAWERQWWYNVALNTFNQAEVLPQFADFDAFFDELYAYFATAQPWQVYPDTVATLEQFQNADIDLGILSNFDSRLYAVLRALNLLDYFRSITISTEVGFAKPNPNIFQIALEKHHCTPDQAWHIGDSLAEDYHAAINAGLHGIWLNR